MKQLFPFIWLLILVSFACNKKPKVEVEIPQIDTVINIVNLQYDIPVDSYNIVEAKVKRNVFLSNILSDFNVDYGTIDHLARAFKDTFDVRKIKVGNTYKAFLTKDSIPKLAYFVYEKSLVDYVVYDFRDSVRAVNGQKETNTILKSIHGTITSSLWNAMVEEKANPLLAIELSEIFAWTVDFFGIAKNDAFKVIYSESYVDSISLGIDSIYGVWFKHMKQTSYAIPFVQKGQRHFFDEDGNSLRKAFLKAPLRFSRISSGYSNSRYHPVLKYYRPHHGIDYAAPSGTPVHSIGDGKIIARAYQKNGGGNYLKIKHNSVYTSTYMHLRGFAKNMVVGKQVKQGETIGYVGMTGIATGPHLDFRVTRNGSPINPLKIKAPPVEPIAKENRDSFKVIRKMMVQKLDQMN